MPEDHDRPDSAGSLDRATDRMSVDPGTPGSDDKTVRISSGDLLDQGTRPTFSAPGTERIDVHQPGEAEAERTQTIGAVVPESATERTQAINRVPQDPPPFEPPQSGFPPGGFPPAEPPTTTWAPSDPPPPEESGDKRRKALIRAGIAAAAVVGVLTLLYVGDLVLSNGTVPRGTVVAQVPIGGLSKDAAIQELKDQLGPGLDEPITVTAGDAKATINPDDAGLKMDWAATVEHTGSQPLNPFTRLTSLFSTREVVPISHGDRDRLAKALEAVKPELDRDAAEGTIRFEGTKPVAVEPVTGRAVDVAGATDAVLAEWAAQAPVRVPFTERPVSTTEKGVRTALHEIAEPAVSAPVTVQGEGDLNATLPPEAIAASLRFEPNGKGGLKPSIDVPAAAGAVEPQLASSIIPGKDAEIVIEGGAPVVRPSVDGHGVDWAKSFEKLPDVLKKSNDRSIRAIYVQQPARFTTDQANQLGIREVVSEFTTSGFETASGVNIKRVAEQVEGAIVKPGETFSLNGHTGPRGTAQGYIESGIIEDGRPAKAVGGGISQFATTLYNASYFAGMEDIEHKEHSYYISRYPEGREATVFQNPDGSSVIDVKFKNTSKHGILITTSWTPESITVQFWSTKQYEVSSETSPRSDPTPPEQKVVPPGEPCSASSGSPGFTVYDTRTLKDVTTGQVRKEEPARTVYDPQPIIHCGPPLSPAAPR